MMDAGKSGNHLGFVTTIHPALLICKSQTKRWSTIVTVLAGVGKNKRRYERSVSKVEWILYIYSNAVALSSLSTDSHE